MQNPLRKMGRFVESFSELTTFKPPQYSLSISIFWYAAKPYFKMSSKKNSILFIGPKNIHMKRFGRLQELIAPGKTIYLRVSAFSFLRCSNGFHLSSVALFLS